MRIAVVTVSKSIHTRIFVEYLVGQGHEVTVITNRDRFEVDGVRTINTRPLGGRRFMLPDRALLALRDRAIRAALREGDFDVVNVQMLTSDGVTASLSAQSPVVVTLYGSDVYRTDLLPAGYLDALPDALRRAAIVHACSRHMTEELIAIGVDPARIETFQYGVDSSQFSPGDGPRRRDRILSVRAHKPLYRIHLIVGAMPLVLETHPEARLAVYDTGPEEPRLRALAESLGITHAVDFLGRHPAETIARDLGESGVWVSMAESDGTPISLLEAMSAGAVPVVGDLDTLHEWLEPSRAVFVTEPTAEAVAEALRAGLGMAGDQGIIAANRTVVTERAERSVNLRRFEALLARAAGTTPRS